MSTVAADHYPTQWCSTRHEALTPARGPLWSLSVLSEPLVEPFLCRLEAPRPLSIFVRPDILESLYLSGCLRPGTGRRHHFDCTVGRLRSLGHLLSWRAC